MCRIVCINNYNRNCPQQWHRGKTCFSTELRTMSFHKINIFKIHFCFLLCCWCSWGLKASRKVTVSCWCLAQAFCVLALQNKSQVPGKWYLHECYAPVLSSFIPSRVKERQSNQGDGGGYCQGANESHQKSNKARKSNKDLKARSYNDSSLHLEKWRKRADSEWTSNCFFLKIFLKEVSNKPVWEPGTPPKMDRCGGLPLTTAGLCWALYGGKDHQSTSTPIPTLAEGFSHYQGLFHSLVPAICDTQAHIGFPVPNLSAPPKCREKLLLWKWE